MGFDKKLGKLSILYYTEIYKCINKISVNVLHIRIRIIFSLPDLTI